MTTTNEEMVEEMVRDFTQVPPRPKSEVRERINNLLAAKDAACEERVREAVTRFREMIWSSATPDFRSTKGGEDCYILKKKDLNNITYLLSPALTPPLPDQLTDKEERMEPQTITLTVEFRVHHTPGTPTHLNEIAETYLQGKGVTIEDGVIVI